MTVIIGVLCQDGVVIGSDSSSTFVTKTIRTIEQKCQKVFVVNNNIILSGSGQIGLGQRFMAIVENFSRQKDFIPLTPLDKCTNLCAQAIKHFVSTNVQTGQYGALLAFPSQNNHYLCEFAETDFQPELKNKKTWFVSIGSGQPIADPFLGLMKKVFFEKKSNPTVKDGIFIVTWALQHCIELNPGGINGPEQIGVLSKNKETGNYIGQILEEAELAEHTSNVKDVEDYLGEYREIMHKKDAKKIPKP